MRLLDGLFSPGMRGREAPGRKMIESLVLEAKEQALWYGRITS